VRIVRNSIVGKPDGKNSLDELDVDGRIIRKTDMRKEVDVSSG